jgi:hypothetical protein
MEQAMATCIPESPDALLTRDQAAAALTESGFPVAPKTLAVRASRGDGPPYQRFGARALYKWDDALTWARSRLTVPQPRARS